MVVLLCGYFMAEFSMMKMIKMPRARYYTNNREINKQLELGREFPVKISLKISLTELKKYGYI